MGKFERKYGRYAIKNLSLILIICYAVGYLLSLVPALSGILGLLTLNPVQVLKGQVWRLVTWVIVPPSSFSPLILISLYFYYSIGHSLEMIWGDFTYNLYIFSGMLFTIVGAFGIYLYFFINPTDKYILVYGIDNLMMIIGATCVSTYYVNMSIFLAFACTFPDASVLLMFIIPVKMKYLGVVYGLFIVYEAIISNPFQRVMIVMSLLNFIVFFVIFRTRRKGSPVARVRQAVRRHEFNSQVRREQPTASVHKCAICGKSEADSPELEFRFCSKCNGNYEYCSEHLFTHRHVE